MIYVLKYKIYIRLVSTPSNIPVCPPDWLASLLKPISAAKMIVIHHFVARDTSHLVLSRWASECKTKMAIAQWENNWKQSLGKHQHHNNVANSANSYANHGNARPISNLSLREFAWIFSKHGGCLSAESMTHGCHLLSSAKIPCHQDPSSARLPWPREKKALPSQMQVGLLVEALQLVQQLVKVVLPYVQRLSSWAQFQQ